MPIVFIGNRRALLAGGGIVPEAVAWSRVVTVSAPRLQLVSDTIAALIASGVWNSLDRIFFHAAENSLQGRTCLKSLGVASAANSPTFTANRGFTGDGLSSYVNTNFNASTAGGNYTQNDAMLSAWVGVAGTVAGAAIGNNNSNYSQIIHRETAGSRRMTVNSTTIDAGYAASVFIGHFLSQRTGAAAVGNFLNGVSENTNATVSVTLANQTTRVLANITSGGTVAQYSDARVAMSAIGKSIPGKEADFYNAMRSYMTAVGVA